MTDETPNTAAVLEAITETSPSETAAIPKRCVLCGDTMHRGTRYGLVGWICDDPECDNFEPDRQ